MRGGFYLKLAGAGISKNRKFYFPYILTCICMIMMFYIVSFLAMSEDFKTMRGGDMIQSLLWVGVYVIAVFALIFLYYTNSFLVRRRQKEFGLYNILGMGKRNLVKILVWENVMTAGISLAAGLGLGILFSKLAEMAAIKLLGGQTGFAIHVELRPIVCTVVLFLGIFLLVMLRMIVSIFRLKPVEMLRSENVGEKSPKGNWLLALIGFILLAAAYYLAVAIMDPMSAMAMFFLAVIMVILATYLLFISGSVVFCRVLQKKKSYYYKTKHFVSLSSMIYRMKRNGAGLASICILSTMVLVTVSSTVSLYVQTEDSVDRRYPNDIFISMGNSLGEEAIDTSDVQPYMQAAEEVLKEHNETAQNVRNYIQYHNYGVQYADQIQLNMYEDEANGTLDYGKMRTLYFFTLEDYNRLAGENRTLEENEVLLYSAKMEYEYDTVKLENFDAWGVEKISEEPFHIGIAEANMETSLFFIVRDISVIEQIAQYQYELAEQYGDYVGSVTMEYGFDLDCSEEKQITVFEDIWDRISQTNKNSAEELPGYSLESKAQGRLDLIGINGGLFFLGILLGAVFLFGTVLIMYYKQISEGYEDQKRFDILIKVGMTRKEVKKSINSQVLTVFFLPLLTAGVHLAFAFPLISKIMMLISASAQKELLCAVTVCCYLVFALFYMIVYWITSKSYYSIVSTEKDR